MRLGASGELVGDGSMASVLPSDSGSLAGWGRDNVVQDLWEWFTFLDKRERIAVVAIEDAVSSD